MKALLLAACAIVALCGASGCDARKPAAPAPAAKTVAGAEKSEQYPRLFSDEAVRADLADWREAECNPDPDPPAAEPPGPGSLDLADAVKARDWRKAAFELAREDGLPEGLSAADRKRLTRMRLSVRMTTAARRGDLAAIDALLKAGADPDFTADSFMGPMAWAARCDRVEVLKRLIAAGAQVDRRSLWDVSRLEYRSTPLMLAAFHGAAGSVRVLLDAGADPNLFEEVRYNLGPWSRRDHGVLNFRTTHDIVRMLLESGANPDLSSGGWRPLMSAAEDRDPDKARMLLDHGADPAARNDEGQTAAMIAQAKGAPEVLAVLQAADRSDARAHDRK